MKWIELIVIRAGDEAQRTAAMELIDQLAQNRFSDGPGEISMYGNAFAATDIGIHLRWKVAGGQPSKSDFGIRLAALLEDFGRVHHTIWVEKKKRQTGDQQPDPAAGE